MYKTFFLREKTKLVAQVDKTVIPPSWFAEVEKNFFSNRVGKVWGIISPQRSAFGLALFCSTFSLCTTRIWNNKQSRTTTGGAGHNYTFGRPPRRHCSSSNLSFLSTHTSSKWYNILLTNTLVECRQTFTPNQGDLNTSRISTFWTWEIKEIFCLIG